MISIKQKTLAYLKAGSLDSDDHEKVQRIILINLVSFVGMTVTGAMAVVDSLNNNSLVAMVLFAASAVYFLARYSLTRYGNIEVSASIIVYSLYLLMIYLVYSGGVENTGPLWIFMVAPVSLFLKGLKDGLLSITVFLVAISTILFFPGNELLSASYPQEFKLRLVYSFLTTTFLSACYEHSRKQSYQYVKDLSLQYERLSKYDPLTGISNRRDATAKLEYEQRKIAKENKKLSIILCDVDHFKSINDEFGHDIGDQVLIQLATLLSTSLRQYDLVARWGGEEFLLVLPNTDAKGAQHIAHKIHHRLANLSMNISGKEPRVTISMGFVEVNLDEDIKTAIIMADQYLYQAKNEGRNRVCGKAD